jgi:hypothetical protein
MNLLNNLLDMNLIQHHKFFIGQWCWIKSNSIGLKTIGLDSALDSVSQWIQINLMQKIVPLETKTWILQYGLIIYIGACIGKFVATTHLSINSREHAIYGCCKA